MVFFFSRTYIPHFLHGAFRYTYMPSHLSEEWPSGVGRTSFDRRRRDANIKILLYTLPLKFQKAGLRGLVDLQLAPSNRAQDDALSCGRISLGAVEGTLDVELIFGAWRWRCPSRCGRTWRYFSLDAELSIAQYPRAEYRDKVVRPADCLLPPDMYPLPRLSVLEALLAHSQLSTSPSSSAVATNRSKREETPIAPR
jgi:hypothetical protein